MPGLPQSLDLLTDLEILLQERHVTRAARRLGVTQSAASQRLSRLRDHFGDPLLVPGQGQMVLSARAEALLGPLSAALTHLREVVSVGEPFVPAKSKRRFVLLGGDLFEAYGVPGLIHLLQSTAPDVTVLAERVGEDYARRLETGTADAAFVPDHMIVPTLRRFALPDEPFVALVRKGHPLVKSRLGLEQYAKLDHMLVAPRGLPGSLVDDALGSLGKSRRVTLVVQHFASAPYILAETDLILTCPATVGRVAVKYFPLRALPLPLELPVDRTSLVWHERSQLDSSHAWLRAQVKQSVAAPRARRS